MPIQLTNKSNIEFPLALWILNDEYDYISDPNYYSVTTLIKSVRQIVLPRLNKDKDTELDISNLVKAQMGSSIHAHVERAWYKPDVVSKALKVCGHSPELAEKIIINPVGEYDIDQIPVYLEQRTIKTLPDGKTKVGGKYDIVVNGELQDYKSTITFTYGKQDIIDRYVLQGSIYRWLNPEVIRSECIAINYIFTDWNTFQASRQTDYPSSPLLTVRYALMSLEETEQYVLNKLSEIKKAAKTKELPKCSDVDLWKDSPKWQYFANPNSLKATKNFDTEIEANTHRAKQNKGVVRLKPAKAKACNYCSALPFCEQAAELAQEGLL